MSAMRWGCLLLLKCLLSTHVNEVLVVVVSTVDACRYFHELSSLVQLVRHELQDVLGRVAGLVLLSQVGHDELDESESPFLVFVG
eukprot:2988869-Prymnesium_polylepis.1